MHDVAPNGLDVLEGVLEKEPTGQVMHWFTPPTVVYQDPGGHTEQDEYEDAGPPAAAAGVVKATPVVHAVQVPAVVDAE